MGAIQSSEMEGEWANVIIGQLSPRWLSIPHIGMCCKIDQLLIHFRIGEFASGILTEQIEPVIQKTLSTSHKETRRLDQSEEEQEEEIRNRRVKALDLLLLATILKTFFPTDPQGRHLLSSGRIWERFHRKSATLRPTPRKRRTKLLWTLTSTTWAIVTSRSKSWELLAVWGKKWYQAQYKYIR